MELKELQTRVDSWIKEYGDALRKLITDDRLVPDREDVLALIDYHNDNPVKMQDFLQHLDAGIPYQYISDRLLRCV